jgi:mutator protein MutT
MGADELWDVTDGDGVPTGRRHRRGDPAWPIGYFHVVAATCAIRPDGHVLMTRRAAIKDHPLMWEFPAGSALAGETSAECAARELEEETGVRVRAADLVLVQRFREPTALFDFYVARVGADLSLRPDPEEVHEAEWVSLEEAERRYRGGRMATPWTPRLDAMWEALVGALG